MAEENVSCEALFLCPNFKKEEKMKSEFEQSQIAQLFDRLEKGELKIEWHAWCFSGGRDWGDWDLFRLKNDDNETAGYIEISDNAEYVRVDAGGSIATAEGDEACSKAYHIINAAVMRDDPEFVEKVGAQGGMPCYPRDYGDISRNDIHEGSWQQFKEEKKCHIG